MLRRRDSDRKWREGARDALPQPGEGLPAAPEPAVSRTDPSEPERHEHEATSALDPKLGFADPCRRASGDHAETDDTAENPPTNASVGTTAERGRIPSCDASPASTPKYAGTSGKTQARKRHDPRPEQR